MLDAAIVQASSHHRGGVYGTYLDGSVRFHTDSIDLKAWRDIGGRNDGGSAETELF